MALMPNHTSLPTPIPSGTPCGGCHCGVAVTVAKWFAKLQIPTVWLYKKSLPTPALNHCRCSVNITELIYDKFPNQDLLNMERKHQCLVLELLVRPICSKDASEYALEFSTQEYMIPSPHYSMQIYVNSHAAPHSTSWGKGRVGEKRHWSLEIIPKEHGLCIQWCLILVVPAPGQLGTWGQGMWAPIPCPVWVSDWKVGYAQVESWLVCVPHFLLKSMILFPTWNLKNTLKVLIDVLLVL